MSEEKSDTILPYLFSAAATVVFLLPIINIKPEWDVFMHPWRPETASALFLLLFLAYGWFSGGLGRTVLSFSSIEKRLIIAPIAIFTLWSGLSAIWAHSLSSVIHHTGVWAVYLGWYICGRWILSSRKAFERFIIGVCVCVLLLSISPLIEFFSITILKDGGTTLGLRFSKYTELTNTLFPLIAAFAIITRPRIRILGYAVVFVLGLFVVMSFSRTGVGIFIAEALAIPIAIFFFPRSKTAGKRAAAASSLAIAGVLIATLLPLATPKKMSFADRIDSPASSESSRIRPFFFMIGSEMLISSPLIGVGADNFGQEFVRYRMQYASAHPDDSDLALADDQNAERAHNEYIQIAAELGVIGIVIFGVLLAGVFFAGIDLLRNAKRASPYTIAAFIGLGAFLASAFVTSYSFRMIQNGIAFFIVLAIAVGGTFGRRASEKTSAARLRKWRILLVAIALLALMLATYSIVRIVALQTAMDGAANNDLDARYGELERAILIDPANATLDWAYAKDLMVHKRYKDSAIHFRRAIDKGKATSVDYTRLSIAQLLGNDLDGAEATIREALRAYPRSPFLYARLAYILERNGKPGDSATALNQAVSLDKGQALTWWNFMTKGGAEAAKESFAQKLPELMELKPSEAIYAIKDEREALHPEEKMSVPGLDSAFGEAN